MKNNLKDGLATPSRKNILALVALVKQFKPLVNENKEITGFEPIVADAPGYVDLLKAILGAIYDLQDFIRNFDKNYKLHRELFLDATRVYNMLAKLGVNAPTLESSFEMITARHKQALDVLDFIASLGEEKGFTFEDAYTKAVNAARSYINPINQKIEELSNETIADPNQIPESEVTLGQDEAIRQEEQARQPESNPSTIPFPQPPSDS